MPRYSEDEARRAIAASRSWADALRRLGMCTTGGNSRTLKKWASRWEIPWRHFDHDAPRQYPTREAIPLEAVLVAGSTYHRGHLKERLYEEGLKQRRCELCGQDEFWHERRISLILDHINGVANDNRLENLRIVCPNCAATLDTHCGRKLQLRPHPCDRCGTVYKPRYAGHKFCSRKCALQSPRAYNGRPQPNRRKVERPPYAQLLAEVREAGFLATGRKYGVSDNAIRKWIRQYEREGDAQGPAKLA